MRYLFFDLEYASSKNNTNKICEFGYVITDECFRILERNNLVINPNINREEWDFRVLKKILTRKIDEYESSPTFEEHYVNIVKLINGADYIIGHSLDGDAKALNDDCKKYKLPSIDFTFYDIKKLYKSYKNTIDEVSLSNMLIELEINGEEGIHDAEVDSINTMYAFKKMIKSLDIKIEELDQYCPNCKDSNINFEVASYKTKELEKIMRIENTLYDNETNTMLKHSIQSFAFHEIVNNIVPSFKEKESLKNITISFSSNYEETHFKEMVKIVQLICNKGGSYSMKATESNYFVIYESLDEDGNVKECDRLYEVNKAILKGKDIKIITLSKLFNILSITPVELENMPMISLNFLYEKLEKQEIKEKEKKKAKKEVKVVEEKSTTLGDLFKDVFDKLKEELV